MTVLDVMAKSPAVCMPTSTIEEVAQMMKAHDCGAIPVVESMDSPKPVGIITDRDIVVRLIAEGKSAGEATAKDAMSEGLATASADMSLEAVGELMERNQVRRIPVVDEDGKVIGVVSQADFVLNASDSQTADLLEAVSDEESTNEEKMPMGGAYSG